MSKTKSSARKAAKTVDKFFEPATWDNDDWGNIPVGNLTDEELHGKNWNKVTANRENAKIGWRKGKNFRSKEGTQRISDATKQRVNNSAEQDRMQSAYQEKRKDPKWYAEWRAKVTQGNKKHSKIVVTPEGEFASRRECARFYGHADSWVLSQIKKRDDWRYKD